MSVDEALKAARAAAADHDREVHVREQCAAQAHTLARHPSEVMTHEAHALRSAREAGLIGDAGPPRERLDQAVSNLREALLAEARQASPSTPQPKKGGKPK